ncbi:MAG: hypothetical protein IJ604_10995 [Prevotella sp.]|nr:hypothetical protein [Prevotella sp.]
MRKLYTLLFLACCLSTSAQNAIVIYQKDGKVANFAFSEKPVATYSDNQLVITTAKTSVQYPLYLLQKIEFVLSGTTSVEQVKSDAKFRFTDGSLHITGGNPGSPVYIYSMHGMSEGQYRIDDAGNAVISLQRLSKGIYIVKTNHFTFKFTKQ